MQFWRIAARYIGKSAVQVLYRANVFARFELEIKHNFERNGILLFSLLALLVLSTFVSFSSVTSSSGYSNSSQTHSSFMSASGSPIYVWFFGFVGDQFYPQTMLNISEQTMINYVANLSATYGRNRLVILTAVDEIPVTGGEITSPMISTIASYVSALHQYAAAVYGRLEFDQFNLNASSYGTCSAWSTCPIYNQSALYINELGLNGIWFDHVSQYYQAIGSLDFNNMMQNLTEMFPTASFILNQASSGHYGFVQELQGSGYTWENQTFVSPTTTKNFVVPRKTIQTLNQLFPGHVILHLDAEGPSQIGTSSKVPMSLFANLDTSSEIWTMDNLVNAGISPLLQNESYATVIPVIGSWTYAYGQYEGTLYNGLSVGNYARSTSAYLLAIAANGSPGIATVSSTAGLVGAVVNVTGSYFGPNSAVEVSFGGMTETTVNCSSSGNFTITFDVPVVPAGLYDISISDGSITQSQGFTVTPSIVIAPTTVPAYSFAILNVTGAGFASNSRVTLQLDGRNLFTYPFNMITNSTGSFVGFSVLYHLQAGNYVVQARDSNGDTANAWVTVT